MKGYKVKIFRTKAEWFDKDKLTDLSKEFLKTQVNFVSTTNGTIYWKWIPANDEVLEIVEFLLKEHKNSKFREDLEKILKRKGLGEFL